jgi:uncharacterized membrane protein YiaA
MRLGASFNTNPEFQSVFHRFHLVVEVLLVAGFAWYLVSHWKNRIRTEAA